MICASFNLPLSFSLPSISFLLSFSLSLFLSILNISSQFQSKGKRKIMKGKFVVRQIVKRTGFSVFDFWFRWLFYHLLMALPTSPSVWFFFWHKGWPIRRIASIVGFLFIRNGKKHKIHLSLRKDDRNDCHEDNTIENSETRPTNIGPLH